MASLHPQFMMGGVVWEKYEGEDYENVVNFVWLDMTTQPCYASDS